MLPAIQFSGVFYEHLACVLLISYRKGIISSLQLLYLFALFLYGGNYLEGEFLKRFALFPFFFRHGQTRYDAHLQDDANCNLRESEYKRDEETLLLKTFALSGRNV